jgi:hypothetical protein
MHVYRHSLLSVDDTPLFLADIMQKPPRDASEPLINGWVFFRYMVRSTLQH